MNVSAPLAALVRSFPGGTNPIRLPVVAAGAQGFVLQLVLTPSSFLKLIEVQAYPPTWKVALIDGSGLHVALALEEGFNTAPERERLRQSEQDALRAADKAKDEFLAMLGHELRNPLSAITAYVLRPSKPDAAATFKAHEVIERQARQVTRLVEDLLDISRLAMSKVTLRHERLELFGMVERVARTWQLAPSRPGAPVN